MYTNVRNATDSRETRCAVREGGKMVVRVAGQGGGEVERRQKKKEKVVHVCARLSFL